jgi:hypothetical protein
MGNSEEESGLKSGAKGKRRTGEPSRTSKTRAVSLPLELDHPDHTVPGSISRDAELARKALAVLPGLSKEQLAELRARLDIGYYKSPTVVAAISAQIARLFSKESE